jgi:hypothetical protein
MWTSHQKSSYIVVTCHYIDSKWRLNRHVLNFFNVSPPHFRYFIADILQKSFQEWGIENKISSITIDNAKPNNSTIKTLRCVFNLRKTLLVDGKLFHMRCCAHITNLLVQDGLDEVTMIVDSISDENKYLVESEGRLLKFAKIAKQLQLPSKKLFLDVPTRRNSTYLMLVATLEFKEAFPMYSHMDSSFQWLPLDEDWKKIENVCQLLGVFNQITNIVSGSDYSTSNLFLPQVWRMKDILKSKCGDSNEYIQSMACKINVKFEKYWGEVNLLMGVDAVLDLRYKMTLI